MKNIIRKILKEEFDSQEFDSDWDWMEDIDPLGFTNGEIYIDIKDLSYPQRIEMFNNLESIVGELNIHAGSSSDTKEERIDKCSRNSKNGILLHCGHEDNDYQPTENGVCCMWTDTFERVKSEVHQYHDGGVTYVNGMDLIETNL